MTSSKAISIARCFFPYLINTFLAFQMLSCTILSMKF
jgi:hypothetical protein